MRKLRSVIILCFILSACFSLLANAAEKLGELEDTLASDGALWQECALGDAAADAVRAAGDTQLAIIGGGSLGYSLIYGVVEETDLVNAFPEDLELYTAVLTPQELTQMLETLVSHAVSNGGTALEEEESAFDGFPQIAGFTFTYDVSAPVGERIVKISLEDGTVLDLENDEMQLTLTATQALFDGTWGVTVDMYQETGICLRQAFLDYLIQESPLSAPDTDRITVKGLGGKTLISYVPGVLIVFAVVLIGIIAYFRDTRKKRWFSFDPHV